MVRTLKTGHKKVRFSDCYCKLLQLVYNCIAASKLKRKTGRFKPAGRLAAASISHSDSLEISTDVVIFIFWKRESNYHTLKIQFHPKNRHLSVKYSNGIESALSYDRADEIKNLTGQKFSNWTKHALIHSCLHNLL